MVLSCTRNRGDTGNGPCTVVMALNMQLLNLVDAVTQEGCATSDNRSSRRSDSCHLCSLQSWKVKAALLLSSLSVNITYSSD